MQDPQTPPSQTHPLHSARGTSSPLQVDVKAGRTEAWEDSLRQASFA